MINFHQFSSLRPIKSLFTIQDRVINRYFWELVATYRLNHTGIKVSKETQEKAREICKKIKRDLEE